MPLSRSCVDRIRDRGTLEPPQPLVPPLVSYQRPLVVSLDWVISWRVTLMPLNFVMSSLALWGFQRKIFNNGSWPPSCDSNSWGKRVKWGTVYLCGHQGCVGSWGDFPFLDAEVELALCWPARWMVFRALVQSLGECDCESWVEEKTTLSLAVSLAVVIYPISIAAAILFSCGDLM